ncbi:MAG: hypothetical protein IKA85_07790 [Clostridia bacterium]|nr:hypothetical protein [Clostridia bacterium]
MSDISKIDKNFEVKAPLNDDENLDFYPVPNEKIALYGVFYENDRFVRLPKEIAQVNSSAVDRLHTQTAGGRLRFSTNSKTIRIIVKWDIQNYSSTMSAFSKCGFTLQEDFVGGDNAYVCSFVPPTNAPNGYDSEYLFEEAKERNFTIYFPLYNNVTELTLAIDKGATLGKGLPYKDIKPILYYGSSITQGGCASRADNSYQSIIAKWNNIDHINLGFSGGCRAEEPISNYMAGLDVSIFVCDYDHNAPTVEFLQNTHFKLYETFRSKNPGVPILFLSRPNFYTGATMNPEARLKIIKETVKKAKKLGDDKVYLLDGRKLFGKEYKLCTVDGTHPNDIGFYLMAKAINKMLDKIIKENNLLK